MAEEARKNGVYVDDFNGDHFWYTGDRFHIDEWNNILIYNGGLQVAAHREWRSAVVERG